jgi:ketosteroid isomerase-like protein
MKALLLIICAILAVGCQTRHDDRQMANEIMETDRNFNKMAQEKGLTEAFVHYADEAVILMRENEYPIIGKYELMLSTRENTWSDKQLRWEPLRAEASVNLGYTFGSYQLQTRTADGLRDTTIHGNYVSVWKRKRDGSWRYVVDGGNDTPGPVSLERKK